MYYPKISSRNRERSSSRYGRQSRGLGLLEVMLLIAVISSLLIGGYLQWRVRGFDNSSRQEKAQLAQADAALLAFVTIAHRMPCPDNDRDGLEDCAGNIQKGWLPVQTLRLAGADPGVKVGQLRYLVQRGNNTIDLTSAADDWRPLTYDGTAIVRSDTDYAGSSIITLSDFCARVEKGNAASLGSGVASIAASPTRLAGYALAHPGNEDADGDGDLFDGRNAMTNDTQLEPGDRWFSLGLYDDVVLERSMSSLQKVLGCTMLNNAIDSTALAYDAVVAVDDMRKGNIKDAVAAGLWAGASALLTGLSIINTGLGIASDGANSGFDAGVCAASLGIAVNACVAIGLHISAATFAIGEIVTQAVSVGLSLTAVGLAVIALALADSDATEPLPTCTVPNVADAVAAMNSNISTAQSSRTLALSALATARSDKIAADTARDVRIAAVRNAIRGNEPPGTTSSIDGLFDPLLGNASTLMPLEGAYQEAVATQSNAQSVYNGAVADVVRYQDLIDNQADRAISTRSTLANESQTLANLRATPGTPEQTIIAQEREVNRLQFELLMLEEAPPPGQTPTLVVTRDAFVAQRDITATVNLTAANTALTTATNNRATAATDYASAYATLRTASLGIYTISLPLGSSPAFVLSCTAGFVGGPSACGTTTISTFGNVTAALSALFGFGGNNGSLAPQDDSVYNAPEKLQKKINALDKQILDLNATINQLTEARDKLNQPITLPADCLRPPRRTQPFKPADALPLVINVDRKGGTR